MTDSIVNRGDNRYEILVGGRIAGFAEYLDRDTRRIFYHTEIHPEFQGQGLSSTLIERAVTDTRDSGRRIVAVCPAVASWLKKHDQFADVTDPVTTDVLQ